MYKITISRLWSVAAKWWRVSGLVVAGSHLSFLWMMYLFFFSFINNIQLTLGQFATRVKWLGWKLTTQNLRPCSSVGKRWSTHLGVLNTPTLWSLGWRRNNRSKLLSQEEELKIERQLVFHHTSCDVDSVHVCYDEGRAQCGSWRFTDRSTITCGHKLWKMNWKNDISTTNGRNELTGLRIIHKASLLKT